MIVFNISQFEAQKLYKEKPTFRSLGNCPMATIIYDLFRVLSLLLHKTKSCRADRDPSTSGVKDGAQPIRRLNSLKYFARNFGPAYFREDMKRGLVGPCSSLNFIITRTQRWGTAPDTCDFHDFRVLSCQARRLFGTVHWILLGNRVIFSLKQVVTSWRHGGN